MYTVVIGRFQPLHNGHVWLIEEALKEGHPVLVLVRDDGGPYLPGERIDWIHQVFEDRPVTAVAFPDVAGVIYGRGVGYKVQELPECPIKGISGTAIREKAEGWEQMVPEAVRRGIT